MSHVKLETGIVPGGASRTDDERHEIIAEVPSPTWGQTRSPVLASLQTHSHEIYISCDPHGEK